MANRVFPLLVCPLTKQRLLPLDGKRLGVVTEALARGELRYADGTVLPADGERIGFLITENAHHLYTVIDKVPVLLESRQVDIQSLNL